MGGGGQAGHTQEGGGLRLLLLMIIVLPAQLWLLLSACTQLGLSRCLMLACSLASSKPPIPPGSDMRARIAIHTASSHLLR